MGGPTPFRVGVITDRMDDARAQVIGGLESVVRPAGGVVLIVVHHRQNPTRGGLLRHIAANRFDAALLLPLNSAESGESRLDEVVSLVGDLPAVTVGTRHPAFPYVDVAETVLAADMIQHLIGDCHRRWPVLVGSSGGGVGASRRHQALEHAALTRGLTLRTDEDLLRCVDQHSAQEAMSRWLAAAIEEVADPTRALDSVICGSDELAAGVLAALADRGLGVPDDVAVVSYGDTDASWTASPPLTSIDERLREQGAAAGRHLIERLAGRGSSGHGKIASVAAGRLVVRASSLLLEGLDSGIANDPEAPPVPASWTDDLPGISASGEVASVDDVATDDGSREAGWRRRRRREAARGAVLRSNDDLVEKIELINARWRAANPGPMSGELQASLVAELVAVVRSFPETSWWRAWLQLLPARLEAESTYGTDEARQFSVLATSLLVERVLAEAREERERRAHAVSRAILELEQSLVGCDTLVALNAVWKAFLTRLGIVRCFTALYEEALPFDQEMPTGQQQARLVMCFGVPGHEVMAANDAELWSARPSFHVGQVLPPELAGELDHDTLMIQPIFGDESRLGYFAYEGSGQDRFVGETLRVAMARVLQAKATTAALTARSAELARLVAERTAELEIEMASRQQAQEELKAANETLRLALLRDGLTGLFNRPALDDHLVRAWRRTQREGRTFSLLMVDVDHFKSYNDAHGHLAGDECLRRVARLLAQAADRPDDMVARYGGEEFAVVLGETDLAGAAVVAERVVRTVRESAILHHGTGGVVTVSVGVASSLDHLDVADVIDAADRALYRAKADGRDAYRLPPTPDVMTPIL